MDDARRALDELIQQRGVNYSSVSRLLGRNAAYIQQYIRRGSPRQLDEQDRSVLARFFGRRIPRVRRAFPADDASGAGDWSCAGAV